MLPFLPAVLGALGTTAAKLSALQAGLGVGLGTALITKDINKGLTAGLGAFGGGSLASGLGQAGQIGASAVNTPSNIALGKTIASPEVAKAGYQALGTAGERAASIGRGIGALGDPAALQAAGGGGSLAMSGLTALTPTLDTSMDVPESQTAMIRPFDFDYGTGTFTELEPYQARQGGIIPGLASQVRMQGGGRYLSGKGDGMSDSIDAKIQGGQEARLSDGEFVVPADVVSGLGNGSSDAGAKRLHGMMDRVRKERTGTKKQAPEVDIAALMPA